MAAPPPMFSDFFNDATNWDEPVPDYDALILLLGGVAGTALVNLARRSPTLIALCPAGDNKYIYVARPFALRLSQRSSQCPGIRWQHHHPRG